MVINTLNTRYTIHSTMKDIEAKLPESEFLRVHRSFIVRIDKIVAIEQPNLILENDKKIDSDRRQLQGRPGQAPEPRLAFAVGREGGRARARTGTRSTVRRSVSTALMLT